MNIVKLEMNIIIRHTQPDPLEHPGVNATMEMHNNQPSQAALLPCLTKKLTEAKNKTHNTHTHLAVRARFHPPPVLRETHN